MDESSRLERRAFRRRSLVAFAASVAIHSAFFALLFCLRAAPPGAPGSLAISLQGAEGGHAGEARAGIAPRSAPKGSGENRLGDRKNEPNAGEDGVKSPRPGETPGDTPGPAEGAAQTEGAIASSRASSSDGNPSTSGNPSTNGTSEAGKGLAAGESGAEGGAIAGGGASARGDPAAALSAQVLAAVEARKTYPDAARRRGTEGRVRLRFSVAQDGRLLSAKLVASSGSALLDRSALELFASVFPVENAAGRGFDNLELSINYGIERR
jgi:TonB family protein